MRKFILIAVPVTVAIFIASAADWPTTGGSPQRDAWAKAEKAFTRQNAKSIELLYKFKADNENRGLSSLTTPIVDGMLITYLGFKEMLVFGGSQDNVYSIDADLNRRIWKTHFEYKGDKAAPVPTAVCPGGLTAAISMPGSSTASTVRVPAPVGRGVAGRGPATAATPTAAPGRGGLFNTGFGRAGVFMAISSDGMLHPLNTSTGADRMPPIRFLPANAKVAGLNINDGVVYVATQDNCGGNPNAIYALELAGEEHKLSTFETHGVGAAGSGGTAIGTDGTVFAQIPEGSGEVAGTYNDTVLAFSKDLKVKDYFTPPDAGQPLPKDTSAPGITPVIFSWKGREVVVSGSRNGRIYLLDGKSIGGADHHTPLAHTESIASADLKFAGNGFSGTFSSWEDPDTNTRWIYAALRGPANPSAKFDITNGDAPHGGMVAFKLEEVDGKPVLVPVWISRDLTSPAPPVTGNGLVFALSQGESNREAKENGKPYTIAEREKMASKATLYVLDGATGAELYSSGNMTSTFSHESGLAVANRRIYFTTHDNTVFALGFLAEQPQLTGK